MAVRTWFMAAVLGFAAPAALAAPVTFSFMGSFNAAQGNSLEQGLVEQYGSAIEGTLTLNEETLNNGPLSGSMTLDWGGFVYSSDALSLTPMLNSDSSGNYTLFFGSPGSVMPLLEFTVEAPANVTTLTGLTALLLAESTSVGYFIDASLVRVDIQPGSVLLDGEFGQISQVPLPAAAWLFLSVLAGASGLRRITRNTASS